MFCKQSICIWIRYQFKNQNRIVNSLCVVFNNNNQMYYNDIPLKSARAWHGADSYVTNEPNLSHKLRDAWNI